MALATESSGYVWLRAPNGLVHILLVIRLEHKFGRFSFNATHISLNSCETSFLTFFSTDRQTARPTRGDLEAPSPELKNFCLYLTDFLMELDKSNISFTKFKIILLHWKCNEDYFDKLYVKIEAMQYMTVL